MDLKRLLGLTARSSNAFRNRTGVGPSGTRVLMEDGGDYNGDMAGDAGRLELSTEEGFANYTFRPYGEVSEELRQAGWIEQQEFQQPSHDGEGFVAVWEKPVGGNGLGEIPYILIGVMNDKVVRTGTLPPGNDSPEIIKSWVNKVALQMR